MNEFRLVLVILAIALGACARYEDAPQRHDAAGAATNPAHDHGDTLSVTHYTPATELFVEFPPLVKGDEAAFAAHLTRLSDFKPVAEGRLVVSLSGGGQPEERAEAPVSATAGIYQPVLKPQYPGRRRLVFHLQAPGLSAMHDLGEVDVYPDKESARSAPDRGEETIRFTKEQQWRIEFAARPAGVRTLRESVPVTATIRPRAAGEAHVVAPVAGILHAPPSGVVQLGARVRAGQLLGYLAPRLGGETDIAMLDLAVQRARVDLTAARRERERLEGLLAAEAIPERRVREARNREQIAVAELAAAERRAATYRGGGGGIVLKSPISGDVLSVNAAPGAAVADGQQLFHIADLATLWLDANIPEGELARVATPAGAFFRLPGQEQAIVLEAGKNARLIAFGGLIDKETRTVPAIFEFANPDGRLKAGMSVRAALYTGRNVEAVAVPVEALVDDAGQPVVFVQTEGESFQRRAVKLGPRDGDWVAVASGVAAEERVVSRGAYQLRLAAAAPAALGHGHAH